jgi:multidrug transporter EmrE-like cation transporter
MDGANDKERAPAVLRLSVFVPLVLVVAGSLVYHAAAKSIPASLDPAAALIGLYATALAGSIVTYALLKGGPVVLQVGRFWHPTVAAVGLGALAIELGFLLAYRGAWPVSTASVVANAIVAVLLMPLGALAFGEAVTLDKAIGVLLCLIGVSLLQR